jgi:hypothetical protein
MGGIVVVGRYRNRPVGVCRNNAKFAERLPRKRMRVADKRFKAPLQVEKSGKSKRLQGLKTVDGVQVHVRIGQWQFAYPRRRFWWLEAAATTTDLAASRAMSTSPRASSQTLSVRQPLIYSTIYSVVAAVSQHVNVGGAHKWAKRDASRICAA